MADDIFLDAPPVLREKLRWYEVVVSNPLNAVPSLRALAETVYLDADDRPIGTPRRAPHKDLFIPFNPADPRHLQVAGILDEIVKEAYLTPVVPSE